MKEQESWLILHHAPSVGAVTAKKAIDFFGSPQRLILSTNNERKESGLFKKVALEYFSKQDFSVIEADVAFLAEDNTNLIYWGHEHYPQLLSEIYDPPIVLYARGDTRLLSLPQMAIVGSRNPDRSGCQTAESFATMFSQNGVTVISGMAMGIDTAAHQGALKAKAGTIAVLGTGLDRVYPAKNRDLAYEIAQKGLLISEYCVGTGPRAENFPRRNRIISGLSIGTLVVQAALRSGSLITARTAMEQGREVFAIPGSIQNPLSRGCHYLIQQGAKLVETAQDVFDELSGLLEYSSEILKVAVHSNLGENKSRLDESSQRILEAILYAPTMIDDIVEITNLDIEQINAVLLCLELEQKIERLPGAKVQRV